MKPVPTVPLYKPIPIYDNDVVVARIIAYRPSVYKRWVRNQHPFIDNKDEHSKVKKLTEQLWENRKIM